MCRGSKQRWIAGIDLDDVGQQPSGEDVIPLAQVIGTIKIEGRARRMRGALSDALRIGVA